ncbi:fimbrial protein [Acinetobacter guillouiae]|uniref:fimbrial protein n=1 Tax=Acinetobacter guillouiae TaxID=106649 RepID=UPI001CD30683|nr:type 1 fimbrial protein [Acinetobacter guillouiae]
MKKLTLATLSTLALTLPCTSVFAVDGTITVNGVVTDQTCTLEASFSLNGRASGLKDITINFPAVPKSMVNSNINPTYESFWLSLKNATNTGACDAATSKAFKGIHLSAISPDHLDTTDKTLLVNNAADASTKNPIFIQFATYTGTNAVPVDLSAPWGTQARSDLYRTGNEVFVSYQTIVTSKTGVVDAQNVQATVNYTLMYN